jgi:hypothetical protein
LDLRLSHRRPDPCLLRVWMEVVSTAISALGFTLDLVVQRVLTRMRKRSATRSGGASA